MRLKPRHNPDVNDYWICDAGRYNYHFIDENRILSPQYLDKLVPWSEAVERVAEIIQSTKPDRIGVLASAQLTNEDLFVIRKLFKDNLKVHVDFRVPEKPGDSDDFLIKADKNPNTAGASAILGAQTDAQTIVQKAKQGELDLLYVFGHDLVKLFGKDTVAQIAKKTKLFVFQGSNVNDTCGHAHLNLPGSVYAEKDGTFTNCQQRVQRIRPAFFPLGDSKSDWEIVSFIAGQLGAPLSYKGPQDVFNDIAKTVAGFAGMSYEKIGDQGMILKK
jgi:NADH-quinone oxidoreductase subunit G